MARVASAAIVFTANLAGCVAVAPDVEFPPGDPTSKSAIFVFETSAGVHDAFAFPIPFTGRKLFTLPRSGTIRIAFFDLPLERLELDEGKLELVAEGGRKIPRIHTRALAAAVLDGATRSFEEVPIESFPALEVPDRFDANACALRGGCHDERFPRTCQPCTEPEPPRPVTAPSPPFVADAIIPWLAGGEPGAKDRLQLYAPHAPERVRCDPGEIQFYAASGCAPLGPTCTPGQWPEIATTTTATVVFVDRNAAFGGDGSRTAPLQTISEALGIAAPGNIIAIAAATYPEQLLVQTASITLAGACARETILDAPALTGHAIIAGAPGTGLRIHDLLVRGGNGGVWLRGGHFEMRRVAVEGRLAVGITLSLCSAELEEVVVRDRVRGGIVIVESSTVSIVRSQLDGNAGMGISGSDCNMTVDRVAISGQDLSIETLEGVYGARARYDLSDVSVERQGGNGVHATLGSTVTAENIHVRRVFATGFYMVGSRVTLRGLSVDHSSHGLNIVDPPAPIEVEDVIVLDLIPPGSAPIALSFLGGSGTAKRLAYRGVGASFVHDAGELQSTFELEDLIVQSESVPPAGYTLVRAGGQADVRLARVSVSGAPDTAIDVGPRADAFLEDIAVYGANEDGIRAGTDFEWETCMTIARARVDGVKSRGITAQSGVRVDYSDIVVAHSDPDQGVGIEIRQSGGVKLDRFELQGPGAIGVSLFGDADFAVPRQTCDRENSPLYVRNGSIRGYSTGAELARPEVEPEQLMIGVIYSGNAAAIVRTR